MRSHTGNMSFTPQVGPRPEGQQRLAGPTLFPAPGALLAPAHPWGGPDWGCGVGMELGAAQKEPGRHPAHAPQAFTGVAASPRTMVQGLGPGLPRGCAPALCGRDSEADP